MKPKPLKDKWIDVYETPIIPKKREDKVEDESWIEIIDIKSAVEGLIKFHEDRIEELIYLIENTDWKGKLVHLVPFMNDIKIQYESIMAIEYWLEDVI